MSTETTKTSPYQLRREAVARALKAWQNASVDDTTDLEDADDLELRLYDEDLVLMPRSTGSGKWVVHVDGMPACRPSQDRPVGPMDAEDAAELWLTLTAADRYAQQQVSIRPATDVELVASVWDHITGGAG